MNQSEKHQKWPNTIQEQKQSQLSIKAFCQQNKISYQTFYYWSKQITAPVEAQKVQLIIIDNSDTQFVAIILPTGMRVEIPCSLSRIQIKTWIEALQ